VQAAFCLDESKTLHHRKAQKRQSDQCTVLAGDGAFPSDRARRMRGAVCLPVRLTQKQTSGRQRAMEGS